jgi:hypothetical protein
MGRRAWLGKLRASATIGTSMVPRRLYCWNNFGQADRHERYPTFQYHVEKVN